jgi:hypothetical protein
MDDLYDDDELFHDHLLDQAGGRIQDYQSSDPVAFARHLARIRQHADGNFEHRAPDGNWYLYEPGGFPYGAREVDALRARGDRVTTENVLVRWP